MKSELEWITARPSAHRGYHNIDKSVYENTLSSCAAAIEHGFNIEVDLHPASDGTAVIFHDLTLERMTGDELKVRELTSVQLRNIKIGNSQDYIATLEELLLLTAGKVGLILEIKGLVGEDTGFVKAISRCLENYQGPVAIMSFYHWLLRDARKFAPHLPLGLIAKDDDAHYASHKMIADECNVDFVSYKYKDMPCRFSDEFRKSGKPLLCWTVKTPEQMKNALLYSDQITFEGFDPDQV
ncbi:MAG: glycerophosphodiester phosphodiesterase [Rhizobiaceae bacterium]|nr:glycerophosphodiester phosphodiesterase [Rhizobiaceae bacterium]